MQRQVTCPDIGVGGVQVTANTAEATIAGVEATAPVGDRLTLNAFLGYTHGEYDKVRYDLDGDASHARASGRRRRRYRAELAGIGRLAAGSGCGDGGRGAAGLFPRLSRRARIAGGRLLGGLGRGHAARPETAQHGLGHLGGLVRRGRAPGGAAAHACMEDYDTYTQILEAASAGRGIALGWRYCIEPHLERAGTWWLSTAGSSGSAAATSPPSRRRAGATGWRAGTPTAVQRSNDSTLSALTLGGVDIGVLLLPSAGATTRAHGLEAQRSARTGPAWPSSGLCRQLRSLADCDADACGRRDAAVHAC